MRNAAAWFGAWVWLTLGLACDATPKVPRLGGPSPAVRGDAAPNPASASTLPQPLVVRRGKTPSGCPFVELGVDLKQATLRTVFPLEQGLAVEPRLPDGALAMINGGYFDAGLRPTTWVRDRGSDLTPRRQSDRGGVLALSAERFYLGKNLELPFEPAFALQSAPLLVEGPGVSGIRSDDGRRAARTLACSRSRQLVLVVLLPRVLEQAPTLYELAQQLLAPLPEGFACEQALNLDGGPSTGIWLPPPETSTPSPAAIAYAVAVMPRVPPP